jgi:hypothetical protein
MSDRTFFMLAWWIAMFVIGFLLSRLGFSIGDVIAIAAGLVAAMVIVPCAFAGLFIDLDKYKDQRQQ